MKYINRNIEPVLRKYLELFPVVGITGPRQSGKTSLLKNILKDEYKYITFDDYQMIDLFYKDPVNFIKINNNKIIFDEIHKVPEIFNYLKIEVDNDRQNYGKYIITASAQFNLMENVSESLAGRIGLLNLLPLDFAEKEEEKREVSIFKGSYPELVTRNYIGSEEWYSSYLETYVQRDLRSIANIGDLRDFRKLIQILASRVSQILNLSEISKQIGVAVTTVKKWISILETSFIIFLLPPFYENFGKRITKSPKIYFYDTGLVAFLVGISTKELYEKGPMRGSLFENFIIAESLKKEKHNDTKAEFYYYRTSNGVEVDLIIDRRSKKEIIEIKNNSTFRPMFTKGIELLTEFLGNNGILVYCGKDLQISEKISAINYKTFLK